jgi:hypothetical protein
MASHSFVRTVRSRLAVEKSDLAVWNDAGFFSPLFIFAGVSCSSTCAAPSRRVGVPGGSFRVGVLGGLASLTILATAAGSSPARSFLRTVPAFSSARDLGAFPGGLSGAAASDMSTWAKNRHYDK